MKIDIIVYFAIKHIFQKRNNKNKFDSPFIPLLSSYASCVKLFAINNFDILIIHI